MTPNAASSADRAAPVGVFDSGVGGLTVLRELLRRLPGESFVYFGDTARVPYGNKSADVVERFSRENIALLRRYGVKAVVVACNTASAEALPRIAPEVDVPVVGVLEPGVRAAVEATRSGVVGVIGTAGTIRSGAYQAAIRRARPDATVHARACPMFVPLAEEGWVDTPVTREVARIYLEPLVRERIDTLVLGCTHYPLLRDVIADTVGAGVTLVDSAVETAREVERLLEARGLRAPDGTKGAFRVLLSDRSDAFAELAERFLGRRVESIEHASAG